MSQLNFNVAGDPQDDQPTLTTDNPPGGVTFPCTFEGDPINRLICVLPEHLSGGATVRWQQEQKSCRVIVPPGEGSWEAGAPPCQPPEDPTIAIIYDPPAPPMVPLRLDGKWFIKANGELVHLIGCSDFALWQRYAYGQDVQPVLDQRKALGFNTLRVFGMYWGGLGQFDPRPCILTLRPFVDYLAAHGFYVEFCVFADTPSIMPNPDEQRAWWATVNEQIAGCPNVILEAVNEGNDSRNTVMALSTLSTPTVFASRGSCTQDAGIMEPAWHYGAVHPARGGSEWHRKPGHYAMELCDSYKIPVGANECKRPDEDGFHPYRFEDCAAAAALLCPYAVFHSTSGKASVLFTDLEANCAASWVLGAQSVPLEYQRGFYRHRTDLETDGILRAYSRVLPDGREYVVRIRS